jgi:hypothetical protein
VLIRRVVVGITTMGLAFAALGVGTAHANPSVTNEACRGDLAGTVAGLYLGAKNDGHGQCLVAFRRAGCAVSTFDETHLVFDPPCPI